MDFALNTLCHPAKVPEYHFVIESGDSGPSAHIPATPHKRVILQLIRLHYSVLPAPVTKGPTPTQQQCRYRYRYRGGQPGNSHPSGTWLETQKNFNLQVHGWKLR